MQDGTHGDAHSWNRTLLVLRHAKSAWDSNAATDLERPLAPRGVKNARRMGAYLAEEGLEPDLIVVSPARRARETTDQVLAGGGFEVEERSDDRIYGGDLSYLLGVLADCPSTARRVLLVGHNPGLEILARYLAEDWGAHALRDKFLPTCALAHLAMPDSWNDLGGGDGRAVNLVRAKEL